MNTQDLFDLIDDFLPDEKVALDFLEVITSDKESHTPENNIVVDLEIGQVVIPTNTKIEIITKAVFKEYTEFGFGAYKVMIAVGGIERQEYGIIIPKYCFSTLYYSDKCTLITADFHETIR